MGAAEGRRRGDDEVLTAAATAVSAVRSPVAAASVPVISGALGGQAHHLPTVDVASIRSVSMETDAKPQPLRPTQARMGDTLHDSNGAPVAVVIASATDGPRRRTACIGARRDCRRWLALGGI